MRIVNLKAENVKRLKAVDITPDGDVVVISGRNAQGKTSVVDSIWFALAGGSAMSDTPQVIRDGQETATAELDLGDMIVTRTWKGDKTELKVMSRDGAKYPSPQKFLDEKLGALSFDPLEFAQQDAKNQVATLVALVKLPFDPDELERKRLAIFDGRSEVNRRIKTLEGQLNGCVPADEDVPSEELNVGTVMAEFQLKQSQVAAYEMLQAKHAEATAHRAQLREQYEAADSLVNQIAGSISDLDPPPDMEDVTNRLNGIDKLNQGVRAQNQRRRLEGELIAERDESETLTKELTKVASIKSEALAKAKMPIDDLAFDSVGVTYRDVPLKQCSSAEQLRVSVAMAMAMNPTIRVIRITDGSLLDSENLGLIAEMAKENDFQIWVERVDESGAVGFVIEDGSVKS